MELTLGPVPFLWDRKRLYRFYEAVAQTPVQRVYVGEVVCSKRAFLGPQDLLRLGALLEGAGKELVVSTPGILTHPEEMDAVRALLDLPYPLEANHLGVLHLAWKAGRQDVVAGPHIAIYNGETARWMAQRGVSRMVFLPELPFRTLRAICEATPQFPKEIQVFGPLPLAFSWRCYTARAMALPKSRCGIVCKEYPEGMPLETLEGQPIFNINGTQLISAQRHCLLEHLDQVRTLGIQGLRLVPDGEGILKTIHLFHDVLQGRLTPQEALQALPEGPSLSNGWFFGRPGWEYVPASEGTGIS